MVLEKILIQSIIVKQKNGWSDRKCTQISYKEVKIFWYADDALLSTGAEEDLQKLLNTFKVTRKKYGIIGVFHKKKYMTTSKEPLKCKLQING